MFNLGELIQTHILWIIPVITIILTLVVLVASTPDNEHLSLKDFLSVGVNLCISAITILLTNYQSVTTAWLVFFFFVITLFIAIITRKFMWGKSTHKNVLSCVLHFIIGLILFLIACIHIFGGIQTIIK